MTRAAAIALAGFVACAVSGCSNEEPCTVPGVATPCSCAPGVNGARACLPSRSWSACDCSGRIPLPEAVAAADPAHESGGAPAAGSGGRPSSGGTGGTAPPPTDGGMTTPPPPAGTDAGPMTDASVPPITPDGGTDAGGPPVVSPGEAYRGCMADTDCDPGALCIQTPGVPAASTVCAPACVNDTDCPIPEGTYEATFGCVTGNCELNCTPVLFAPLLTCPPGMTCIAAQLGNAFCHDDGM